MRDFKRLQQDPPAGISGAPQDNNIMLWNAVIFGPYDTPWDGGTFKLMLQFTEDYPNKPPTVRFVSRMFHRNIYADGIFIVSLNLLHSQVVKMSTPARKRLMRDFKSGAPQDNNIMLWNAVIFGPYDTPWDGGTFKLMLQFTEDYPNKPPTVCFVSRMFHRNIYTDGKIKNLYDVILSEAQIPNMNSYHFLQHVTQQIRIPVIMMCVDQSTTPRIEKGACGYWIKPLSEVTWNNVRGIKYFNELQTDTSLTIEAKLMKKWEFDNIAQAASCMSSWFSGIFSEQLLLKEHLDSSSGEIFYDASRILLSGDLSERQALVEAEGISSDVSVCDKYLAKTAELLTSKCMTGDNVSDPSSLEILKEPFFSAKLLRLIGILTSIRLQQNRKCIIFVNRIVTARSLSYILQQLKLLSQWKVFTVTSEFVATEKHNHSIAV
ncbi:hypothetical protein RYX36_036387 [Vicia faba]